MGFRTKVGWTLLIVGIMIFVYPFINGFTGFFVAGYSSYLPSPESSLQWPMILAGLVLTVTGYVLAKPRKKSLFNA